VHHAYADIVKPGVRFVQAAITSIDPVARHVETEVGAFDADVLVVALGADLHPDATSGLVENGTSSTRCRRVRVPRRARVVRGRTGDRGGHLRTVQVPAGTE
jgi:NADH dehydrogenase FAD-containing subunit